MAVQTEIPLTSRTLPNGIQPKNKTHAVTIEETATGECYNRSAGPKRKLESVRQRYERIGSSLNKRKYSSKLLQVVEDGDCDSCKLLVEGGVDVNFRDKETGMTALHIAARNGNFQILNLLLQNGSDCNMQDDTGQSPLHYAVAKDHVYCSQILLACDDLKINITNKTLDTPLHLAAKEGRYNICLMILKHPDVVVNAKNKKSMTPLHSAAHEKHDKILQLLLQNNADWKERDYHSLTPLHIAANKGFPFCCQVLLSGTSEANKDLQLAACTKDGKTPLMLAAKGGHHRCCKVMGGEKLDAKDKMGNTALHYAVLSGFENTVTLLLEMGCDPNTQNKKGSYPILDSAAKKKAESLKILSENGADLNVFDKQGRSILHYAVERNSLESLSFLLDRPDLISIIDKEDSENCAPLHLAIKKEAVECAKLLLEKGASSVTVCAGGMTPLHLAANKGYTGICGILLSKRESQVSKVNSAKATPLHMAALHGSVDVCQMLIRKGARLTAVDGKGRTALHVASSEGFVNVVKYLSRRGVPQRTKDDTGSTALHLAASKGNLQCCKELVSYMKATCWEVDINGELPLDRAFKTRDSIQEEEIEKYDLVFQHLLACLGWKEKNEELLLRIHEYMETALSEKRIIIIEAIVNSSWWQAGTSGLNGHQCHIFRELIANYPEMAMKLQDKCVSRSVNSNSTVTYDFRLFEDSYYIPSDDFCLAKDPFDPKTHRLTPNAMEYTEDNLEWKRNHPLTLMISHQRHQMLLHPLTKMWLLQKWKSYIYIIFLWFLLIELLSTICLTSFMGMVTNWQRIQNDWNMTKEEFCSFAELHSTTEVILVSGNLQNGNNSIKEELNRNEFHSHYDVDSPESQETHPSKELELYNTFILTSGLKRSVWLALLVLTALTISLECYCLWRLKRLYLLYPEHQIRIIRTVLTIVILIPSGTCEFNCFVLEVMKWQCGIVALLLTWLFLINTLNQIPALSIFMPVTNSFTKSFLKLMFYITLIVFSFAFIFHLLLANQEAFKTIPEALVKTTVWMVGDLAYDNTFVLAKPLYPFFIKVLFLIYVIFLGGFIINLVITQPSNKLESFREKAFFHRAASRAELFLKIDICFPFFRKYKTRGRFVDDESKRFDPAFFTRKLLLLDTKEESNPVTPTDLLQRQLHEQNKQIAQLVTLYTEQVEETKELKHQIALLAKSMTQQTHF